MSVYFIAINPGEPTPHQLMPALWLSYRGYPIVCVIPGDPKGVAKTFCSGAPGMTHTIGYPLYDSHSAGIS